ncbi:hypothetical protein U9M48_044456 [Paspalum notatum var. saurae]|uniref:Bifunctional inhibitor/plant lipid transfer protein/seed storage helical domain-containing protein n=1 Tax=Paspalum notatum var. saurae TaxID=547442 RepID=A0AAQ3UWW2_PASNO
MAKLVAAAALCVAALVAVAVGQGEAERQRLRDLRCWPEVQENPLEACRQVLDRQLTGGMRYGVGPFRWGTGLRMRCCQQLQDVSPACRCAAIRRMVRAYEDETMPPPEGGYYGGEGGAGKAAGGGMRRGRQAGEGHGESGQPQTVYPPRKMTRVRLTKKAWEYAAGLPVMCRIEPQECSVFSGDQYY